MANPNTYSGIVSIIRVTKNSLRFSLRCKLEGVPMLFTENNRIDLYCPPSMLIIAAHSIRVNLTRLFRYYYDKLLSWSLIVLSTLII